MSIGYKKTLVSFLGKMRDHKTYPETSYQMPRPGGEIFKTRFLGMSLASHLKVDRLVLLGTETSMWDNLILEYLKEEGKLDFFDGEDLDSKLKLVEEVLQKSLGMPVRALRIPFGKTESEQLDILNIVSREVTASESLFFDVTHGFRHTPMMSILAGYYLEVVRKVRVKGFYYGAYEMSENDLCPVISLSGYSKLLEWIRALENFEGSGNFGVFAPLYDQEGIDARSLKDAAYFERTNQVKESRNKISTFRQKDSEISQASPLLSLFHPILQQRTDWYRKVDRYEWERELAFFYFKKDDWARTIILLLESFYSRELINRGRNPDLYQERESLKQDFRTSEPDPFLQKLTMLRNVVAHTKVENQDFKEITSPERLKSFLGEAFKRLS